MRDEPRYLMPALMTPGMLHAYQVKAIEFQCTHPESMLWMDMGLGKTAITLTSIAHLLRASWLRAVLIVAPLRVCRLVWRQEALKWSHTRHLTFSMVMGDKDQRTRALLRPANVYLMNYENLQWLGETLDTYFASKGKPLPFDGVVWDEISKMKNSTTHRVRAVKKILPHFKWLTGLTGTPASNGYKDLHGQYLVVDKGKRLGEFKTPFMTRFYRRDESRTDIPYADAEDTIKKLIFDITLEMSAADYNPLPDLIVNDIDLELPEDLRDKYDKMERELFIRLDSGAEVEMFNQAALTNKALQFANGAMYPVAGMPLWEPVHNLKLDALEELVDEAQGQPVWCAYAYRSDAARIMERFKSINPINLTECHSEAALNNAMRRWVSGDCRLMIAHPGSGGHGVDGLQKIGHIVVWFGLNWSLDLYKQFIARVRRQGQGVPVICHRILMRNTLDQVQVLRLETKDQTESGLRDAVKQYRLMKGV